MKRTMIALAGPMMDIGVNAPDLSTARVGTHVDEGGQIVPKDNPTSTSRQTTV